MTDSQIHYMDIISHTGAVRCGVVITEYIEALSLTYGHLSDIGNQIVRNTFGILTNGTALMSTDRVEVS